MTTHLLTIARLELTAAVRLKWIRLLTAAFALLAAAAAYSAARPAKCRAPTGSRGRRWRWCRSCCILVPLAALILGVSGQASEPGSEPFLFGQPVGRATVLVGRWLGESAALGGRHRRRTRDRRRDHRVRQRHGRPAAIRVLRARGGRARHHLPVIAAAIASATDKRVVALGVGYVRLVLLRAAL